MSEVRRKGVHGVPFVIIDGKWAVSGGQTAEVYSQVLASVAYFILLLYSPLSRRSSKSWPTANLSPPPHGRLTRRPQHPQTPLLLQPLACHWRHSFNLDVSSPTLLFRLYPVILFSVLFSYLLGRSGLRYSF
jgi:hypothetical protein